MEIKNLNQLKRKVEVGQQIQVTNYMKGQSSLKTVIEKKSNGIVIGEEISENKKAKLNHLWYKQFQGKTYQVSKLHYQKAKDMAFKGKVIEFLTYKEDTIAGEIVKPIQELGEGATWLEIIL